jgi:hypothetical protein
MSPRRAITRAWFGAGALALCAFASTARAQREAPPGDGPAHEEARTAAEPSPEEIARAREHFDVALSLYRGGRFAQSAAEFQRAYDLSRAPELLHNLYLAHRDAGDLRSAASALRRYLDEEDDIEAEQRSILEHRLQALESSAPTDVPEESTSSGDAAPTEREPPPAPPATEPPWPAIASFAVGALGLGMLVVGGPLALAAREEARQTCAPRCTDAQVDGARTLAIVADVGLGIAAAGAAVGVILLVLGVGQSPREPAERALTLVPIASPTSAGLVVEGRL